MQGKGAVSGRMPSMASWKSASSFEVASPFRSMAAVPGTQEPATLTGGTLLTESTVATPPTQAPSTTAPTAEKLDYLNAQLNTFGPDDVVLERFKMLGEWERRQGGAPRSRLMQPERPAVAHVHMQAAAGACHSQAQRPWQCRVLHPPCPLCPHAPASADRVPVPLVAGTVPVSRTASSAGACTMAPTAALPNCARCATCGGCCRPVVAAVCRPAPRAA